MFVAKISKLGIFSLLTILRYIASTVAGKKLHGLILFPRDLKLCFLKVQIQEPPSIPRV